MYDSSNRVKSYTDNNGFVIAVVYDAAGNIIQAKDQNNNITVYTYDSLNRVKTTTYPDGKYMQYGYDKKKQRHFQAVNRWLYHYLPIRFCKQDYCQNIAWRHYFYLWVRCH
ncbi:MAG: hypothetical protein IPL97_02000 [Niastella sp.]|nr:hypothetical protein [Niastella sp.]